MLFNSVEFAVYLPIVFILYWFVTFKNLKIQNFLLVVASYFFYGWWDWRFLSLIAFSSLVDYLVGIGLHRETRVATRKWLLAASILVNLGFLMFFKYFNFFAESFASAFTILGKPMEVNRLRIILPVGISFYTFQTLSYSIDIYRRKIEPTKDIVAFFAFVSFFPQLVAGPIERASNLLPQFLTKRQFDNKAASDGIRQILWGLFKKIVIADNCAVFVNEVFGNYEHYSGATLFMGAIMFSFQIYGDFSGYSDIAIGTGRLFGFNLRRNFAYPYFSRDVAEFWRRWHISLTTWFRDYVYIPLGGSKGNNSQKIRNIFVIFLVSGFWHGANWTFIVWGALNAIYFLPLILLNRNRIHTNTVVANNSFLPSVKEVFQMLTTFLLISLSWVFFRSESIGAAFLFLKGIAHPSLFNLYLDVSFPKRLILVLFILIVTEWLQRHKEHGLDFIDSNFRVIFRWSFYYMLILSIIFLGGINQDFIYFQF